LLLTSAFVLAKGAERVGLPGLLGMIFAGIAFSTLPWPATTEAGLATLSEPVRAGILAVVLLRAGLAISRADLRRAGSLALLLGTLPMLADALAVTVASHWLLALSWPVAFVVGFLVAAISPAIVIPTLIDQLSGSDAERRKSLTPLLAGAPLDNISALLGLGIALDVAAGGTVGWRQAVVDVPISVFAGIATGVAAGLPIAWLIARKPPLASAPSVAAILIGTACALVGIGQALGISYALAIVACGAVVRELSPDGAQLVSEQLARVWSVAKYALFALIGAALNLAPLASAGGAAVVVIGLGQLGRAAASWLVTSGRGLSRDERIGAITAYIPKATIQAAFAGLALDHGLADGQLILSIGVLAIVLCAPVGVSAMAARNPSLRGRRAVGGRVNRQLS